MGLESVRTTAPSTAASIDPPRRHRADARRTVIALVEAAKTVFAGSGVDAPAKEITDLAGVGVGTLYRHFPRRFDLIVAMLQHEVDECVQAAEELGTTLGPWEALMGWIERFTEFVGTKRGLASALHSGDPAYDDLPNTSWTSLNPRLLRWPDLQVDPVSDTTSGDVITLGEKAPSRMSRSVLSCRSQSRFLTSTMVDWGIAETPANALPRSRTELLGQELGRIRRMVSVIQGSLALAHQVEGKFDCLVKAGPSR
jgi:AcrR family transcriptional regulator